MRVVSYSSLMATPLDLESDRICALQLKHSSSDAILTIVGAYLPSTDHPIEEFDSYLQHLESIVISRMPLGPVLIVGDLNAHIDTQEGTNTNVQGQLLMQLMDRCSLYPVTLSDITAGPCYTFFRENTQSMIDFALLTAADAPIVAHSEISQHHALNTSDHLPVKVKLDWCMEERDPPTPRGRQINWKKACQEGLTTEYAMRVDAIVRPLLGLQYSSVEDLSQEIDVVASKMEQAAFDTLPLVTQENPIKTCTSRMRLFKRSAG